MRAVALAIAVVATPVLAGPKQFGWLSETETLPRDRFELVTSIYEHTNLGALHERSTFLVLAPTVALGPALELAVPIELVTKTADNAPPASGIAHYGAELRVMLLPRPSPLHAVARVGLARDVEVQSQVRSQLGIAMSYAADPLLIEADVGGVLDVNFGHFHEELRPGLGASVRVAETLRLGAEVYAELSHDPTRPSWVVAGPDLGWSRGGFWLSAALGVGVKRITAAPRIDLGMSW